MSSLKNASLHFIKHGSLNNGGWLWLFEPHPAPIRILMQLVHLFDINDKSPNGMTILGRALISENEKVIKYLIKERKADLDQSFLFRGKTYTPLDFLEEIFDTTDYHSVVAYKIHRMISLYRINGDFKKRESDKYHNFL